MHQHAARKAGHNAAKFLLWNEMRERRSKKVQGFIRRRRAALALGARRAAICAFANCLAAAAAAAASGTPYNYCCYT